MSQEVTSATTRKVAYSLAAGAAAGMAGTADAAISYSGTQDINIGQFGSLNLNIDGDAFTDIKLKNYVFGGNYQGATVLGAPGQLVLSNASFPFYVTSLTSGDLIDSSAVGPSFYGSLGYANNPNSEFDNASGAFIGLSFPIGGNDLAHTHYGWVRVTINNSAGTFVVNDWAYNTVAGGPIRAGQTVPEPTTLGLLAAGAAGVAAMRRRQAA